MPTYPYYIIGSGLPIRVDQNEQQQEVRTFSTGRPFMTPDERDTAERIHSIELTILGRGVGGADLTVDLYGDFHLIPQERPVIAQPSPITSYVEVPGYKNREVDMTESLTGDAMFGPREGTLSFYYENLYRYASKYHLPQLKSRWADEQHRTREYYTVDFDNEGVTLYDAEYGQEQYDYMRTFHPWYKSWEIIMRALTYYVNGRRVKLKLLDDPDYYYTGRLRVSNFKSGQQSFGTVEITYKLDPYRIPTAGGDPILF